jgi:hypothetical protein
MAADPNEASAHFERGQVLAAEGRFGDAIGAKVVSHGRYVAFQMAEVAIPRILFADICGWSRSCGRHPRSHRREALDCFASDRKPRERCVWMTTKPAFPALGAPMSPAWVHGSPHVEDSALPKSVENSYLSVNKAVIRWMSNETFGDHRLYAIRSNSNPAGARHGPAIFGCDLPLR